MERMVVRFRSEQITNEGAFEGLASAFNVIEPGYNTRFKYGAFTRTLADRDLSDVKMLLGHEAKPHALVGVWDAIRETPEGLHVQGHLLMELQDAKDTLVRLRAKALNRLSIGFEEVKWDDVREKDGRSIRDFLEVNLWEISHVVFGGNPGAKISKVRTLRDLASNPRFLEHALCDAGIGERDAKWIVSCCKTRPEEVAQDTGLTQLLMALRETNANLKGGN